MRAFSKPKNPAMTAPSKAIDKLRRSIDVIDDEMHDLLMRRVKIVEKIGALKDSAPGALFIRPEREAKILRRLVSRHKGSFPAAVVARMVLSFRRSDGDIAQVLRAMIESPAFKTSLGTAFKDPAHYAISAVRLSLIHISEPTRPY